MANLHFHYGTMSASKSAALIINAYNFKKNGIPTEIIKPKIDTRSEPGKITSRIGLQMPALELYDIDKYEPMDRTKVLLVDEIQFFKASDIDKLVRIADDKNVIVMCYGLMVDSNEKIFPASCRLIEVGAKLHRLESNCQISGCTRLATHHLRFDGQGNIIKNGDQISVGYTNFKSVCRQHYNQLYHGLCKDKETGR